MQYNDGTVSILAGAVIVTGADTNWTDADIPAGSLFKFIGIPGLYDVVSLDVALQEITISSPLVGPDLSGVGYTISTNFTPNFNIPEIAAGDLEVPDIITRAFRQIDASINGEGVPVTQVTEAYQVVVSDNIILASFATPAAVTLPTASATFSKVYSIRKKTTSVADVTVNTLGGDLIDGSTSIVLTDVAPIATVISDGVTFTLVDGYYNSISAASSAAAAATSESNASDSESNALASEAKAQDWAIELEDVEVEVGKYSSLHHAAKAEASAQAASTAEALVSPHYSNIDTVATGIANVNTTATNIANVNTVALGIDSIDTVAADLTSIISDIETVANDLNETVSEINTVAQGITEVEAVGVDMASVTTVAANIVNISTVAANDADITTTASNINQINTVSPYIASVDAVSTSLSQVVIVANDLSEPVSEIDTVATNINNVNAVGTAVANVNTVATSISNVNSVAADSVDIGIVATNVADVNTVATNIVDIQNAEENANAAAQSLADFKDIYHGASATEPVTNVDVGDLYFNTISLYMKVCKSVLPDVWDDAASGGLLYKLDETITVPGKTTFIINYTVDLAVLVFVNGVTLEQSAYTATNGTSVVLNTGLEVGEHIQIIGFKTLALADVYTKSESDSRYVNETDFATDVSSHSDVAANTSARHAESHTVASHSDTTATGSELDTLTDGSDADALHTHIGLDLSGSLQSEAEFFAQAAANRDKFGGSGVVGVLGVEEV